MSPTTVTGVESLHSRKNESFSYIPRKGIQERDVSVDDRRSRKLSPIHRNKETPQCPTHIT